jgi:TetR/AcrR family transcriptional regulator
MRCTECLYECDAGILRSGFISRGGALTKPLDTQTRARPGPRSADKRPAANTKRAAQRLPKGAGNGAGRQGGRAARNIASRDPGRTRTRIVKAAHHEFARRGLEGARIDEIARRADINKQLLYHYFGGKETLYLHVLEESYDRFRAKDERLDLDALGPSQVMESLVGFVFDGTLEDLEFVSLLRDENMHEARHLKKSKRIQDIHAPVIEIIRKALQRGAKQGLFRSGIDPLQFFLSMVGVVYFYFSNIHTLSVVFERDFLLPEELKKRRQHCIDFVMSAIRL